MQVGEFWYALVAASGPVRYPGCTCAYGHMLSIAFRSLDANNLYMYICRFINTEFYPMDFRSRAWPKSTMSHQW